MTQLELFNDVEDMNLKLANRAKVMTNIYSSNTKDGLINANGTKLLLNYFNDVPKEEKAATFSAFKEVMAVAGYTYKGA
jgi:hypothetical protein